MMAEENEIKCLKHVLFIIDGHHFAIDTENVIDVLHKHPITNVPLAKSCVLGLHNLRGKIVTCLDLRDILGLPATNLNDPYMSIVIKNRDETYSLTIDKILSIVDISEHDVKPSPGNLSESWSSLSRGIYSQDGILHVVLDYRRLIEQIVA